MPPVLYNPEGEVGSNYSSSIEYNYEYPFGWNMKPGSELHRYVLNQVLQRARMSANSVSGRFDSWRKIDQKLTAYIRTDSDEDKLKAVDDRKPVSIVFPYSYAIMETLLSYMVAAFFQDPIFMYEGVSPEDIIGAIMMEKVIDVHCCRTKVPLTLHTNFRDSMSYGLGIVAPYWTRIMGSKIAKRPINQSFWGSVMRKEPEYERIIQEDVVLFEGNALRNVDPYKYLPDPDVPVQDVQKGEFVGWVEETRYINLLEQEKSDSSMFNVKYLKHQQNKQTNIYSWDESGRNDRIGKVRTQDATLQPVDMVYMYIKLVPKEWGLTTSEKPEKWMFAVAADSIIIQAKPLGIAHNMFPVAVSAPDFDGHSCTPLSRIEILYGMQEILDWLFNSHMANVRKIINDTLVVDPYLLNLNDLRDPKAGGIVRLRRPAWGRGVTGSYEQLKVTDITRSHITDSQYIMQEMQKASAADESTMGGLRQGGPERLTGEEYSGTRTGAISRLERAARVIGWQSMQDVGYMFAHHAQQFMTQELYVTTTGRWRDTLAGEFGQSGARMKVSPMDLVIDYDLKVRDGSIPGGNFSKVWIQLFQAITKEPELRQTFDVVRVFKHIARNMGAKSVEDFVRRTPMKTQVMPDEQVESMAQKGNVVPLPTRMAGGL
jgi:hypothetical protein